MEEGERPSPYFGDYPNGAYWSAVRPAGTESSHEDEDMPPELGSELRLLWDESAGPLWCGGLLSDDPKWLSRALGLSDRLIADLLAWMNDMTDCHFGPPAEWKARLEGLQGRGEALAARLQAEVGTRYRIRYID